MRPRTALAGACLAAFVLAIGCSAEPAPPEAASTDAPALPTGAPFPWARRTCSGSVRQADVVACVSGVAITVSDVERSLGQAGGPRTPREALDALVTEELLAQKAFAAGGWSADLVPAHHEAMVHALLEQVFERSHDVSKVTEEDIRKTYFTKGIRIQFDHPPAWFVTDVQFVCCTGASWQCDKPEVVECFQKSESRMRSLAQELKRSPPKSAFEMKARVEELASIYPGISSNTYDFFYEHSKPHNQQKGYDLMAEPVARAVQHLRVGELSDLVMSHNAWHVLLLTDHKPAEHRGPDDPGVRATIVEKIYPLIRARDAQAFILEATRRLGVRLQLGALDAVHGQGEAAAPVL